ncbi:hypothetical protein [Gordonia terrae]
MAPTTPEDIVQHARDVLETARWGYRDLTGDVPERRHHGLRAAIVFGRAVTISLQHLKSHVEDFETWYLPVQAQLKADSGYKRLTDMRNAILKEADLEVGVIIRVDMIRIAPDGQQIGSAGGSSSVTIDVEGETVEVEPLLARYLDELDRIINDAATRFLA